MTLEQQTGANETFSRRYEYDDRWVLVADFGLTDEEIDVDVVGETAIIVAKGADTVREMEFELPSPDAEIALNNGVLTITITK